MTQQLITRLLIICITFSSLLGVPLSASAHDDEAYVELNVTQAQPGMSITLRGSGFEPGDATTIMLMLVSSDRPRVLGTAIADEHGDLVQVISLPADLTDGVYEVRVADTHHVATTELSIVADAGDEEGGQRGEDEPLLAPMPEPSTRAVSITAASIPNTAPPSTEVTPSVSPALLLSSGIALTVLVTGLVIIRRRSR